MRLVALTVATALLLTGCRGTLTPGMSQDQAWRWQPTRKAQAFYEEHPVTDLHPDRPVPEACVYMTMIAAGPGFGVPEEQHNVRKVASLMGATHVQWQDVETAHAYRCPAKEEES